MLLDTGRLSPPFAMRWWRGRRALRQSSGALRLASAAPPPLRWRAFCSYEPTLPPIYSRREWSRTGPSRRPIERVWWL